VRAYGTGWGHFSNPAVSGVGDVEIPDGIEDQSLWRIDHGRGGGTVVSRESRVAVPCIRGDNSALDLANTVAVAFREVDGSILIDGDPIRKAQRRSKRDGSLSCVAVISIPRDRGDNSVGDFADTSVSTVSDIHRSGAVDRDIKGAPEA